MRLNYVVDKMWFRDLLSAQEYAEELLAQENVYHCVYTRAEIESQLEEL